jgi:hypothetical protein
MGSIQINLEPENMRFSFVDICPFTNENTE